MRKIVLASSNQHKIDEISAALSGYEILSLKDIGFTEEIDENGETFKENSIIKAKAVLKFLKQHHIEADIIADDSGLCVTALNDEPGVHSARYAADHNEDANRLKLLLKLEGYSNRGARYVCVMTYMKYNGTYKTYEGRTLGKITETPVGTNGMCYDRLFYSIDLLKTFGEATVEEKNRVSHRTRALAKLKEDLEKENSR